MQELWKHGHKTSDFWGNEKEVKEVSSNYNSTYVKKKDKWQLKKKDKEDGVEFFVVQLSAERYMRVTTENNWKNG